MERKIRLGVIGLGDVFRVGYIPAFQKIEEIDVVMVCSRTEKVARGVGEKLGAEWTTDYLKAVDNEDIEAVAIATPHHLHHRIALAAAERNKHIFCEKPLAIDLRECDEIIEACEKAGVQLMVGENYLFEPGIRIMKKEIQKGTIGELRGIHLLQVDSGYPFESWRCKKEAGGGVLLDPGVHLAALARFFMGRVANTTAKTSQRPIKGLEIEDNASVILEFENGTIGSLEVGWYINPLAMRYEIDGSRGRAVFEAYRGISASQLRIFCSESERFSTPFFISPFVPVTHSSLESYVEEFSHFANCLINGERVSYDGKKGREDVEIVAASYRSAREGKTISLKSGLDG